MVFGQVIFGKALSEGFLPIIAAFYLTRDTQDVAGSVK